MGGSNVSVSDLSVYQSALTQIGQDLESKAENINQQTAKGYQKITFKNGTEGRGGLVEKRLENRQQYITECKESCDERSELTNQEWQECSNYCNTGSMIVFPEPSDKLINALTPTIAGCDIVLNQFSDQSLAATQIASSQVDAEMTANIMNKFESEVEKIISQTNEDINFMQSNSAKERTDISQSVRNEIKNAISSVSKNESTTFAEGKQEVVFTNDGYITCCGYQCDPETTDCDVIEKNSTKLGPGSCGSIRIDQKMIQKLQTDQKATSVIESVFNSSVVNDLYSKYKYDLAQLNKGVDPWGFMYALAIIIGLLIVGAFFLAGSIVKFLNSKTAMILAVGGVIIAIIVVISIKFTKNNPNPSASGNQIVDGGQEVSPGGVLAAKILEHRGIRYDASSYQYRVFGDLAGEEVVYNTLCCLKTQPDSDGLVSSRIYNEGAFRVSFSSPTAVNVEYPGKGYKVGDIVAVAHKEDDPDKNKLAYVEITEVSA